ncbi:putative actin cross-linking [Naematelia encephala]|uniref:Putative actin cross-linking n=1 Tax=Naematelia encephala TaxID=71784 RepID=A0A1Y2ALD1_9TREE|nr:putative actin cross-linking [Naematelia encephala]
MPPSRFGASKFRNAVPHIPGREEWYRGKLPVTASSSASPLSTFSSEIKTNREWIVTLTPTGDLSYRRYTSHSGSEEVGTAKVGSGGGVGDWDLSRLEDGTVAVGGLDGSVSIIIYGKSSLMLSQISSFTLNGELQPGSTIPASSSAITLLSLHPTTSHIVAASSVAKPLVVYDLSTSPRDPTIELQVKEPKGLWSLAWSPDGKRLAAVGKSGTGYIFDPRSSTSPVVSKILPLQALKPVRIAWVGEEIFVTSFSKTRSREYSLLNSSSLSTIFNQPIDTNTAPLIPLIDEERRIVYTAGRGDMSLRQVELSGPMGFQEMIHPLPFPISSTGLALASPTTLPVMQAQIATVLIPVVDKDGDSLLPLAIKVPRRQLIDYHDDLYPDIAGTISEQEAAEWFEGEDKVPLHISLDPSRRGSWEAELAKRKQSSSSKVASSAAPSAQSSPPPQQDKSTTSSIEVKPQTTEADKITPVPSTVVSKAPVPLKEDLPPLEHGEDYASTSYKARIISHHLADQLEAHRNKGKKGPLMVAFQGPQGCGKTTLCDALLGYLTESPRNLKVAVLSLDDLYLPYAGLASLAKNNPHNKLLAGRGPPGTHDVDLAVSVLSAIQSINDSSAQSVELPIFDKSLNGGQGDRSPDTVKVTGPLDVFILEGWSMGFAPLSSSKLKERYDAAKSSSDKTYFTDHSLSSLETLNESLAAFASNVYTPFETIIQIEPSSYENVFKWRLEQEHMMKAKNGGKGMTDEQVYSFVERYMPGYELWKEGIWDELAPWTGRGLRIYFGEEREVVSVVRPKSSGKGTSDTVSGVKPASPSAPSATNSTKPTPQSASATASSTKTEANPTDAKTSELDSKQHVVASGSKEPYNPKWSRKFLAGKTPLNPTYDQVPSLATLHPDSLVLKSTAELVFFPIQGPGGRLAVHPLKNKGRMPVGGEGYISGGSELVDFDIELGGKRVALAGEDGVIRVWTVGEEGVHGPGPEPETVLKGKGIDKIAQIAFHPTAKDLLTALTNDSGKATLRLWDVSSGSEINHIQLETTGAFNMSWSPLGNQVAVSTKDGRILVLDPRDPSKTISGKAHDSARSFQLAWIDDTHLISVGFSRGSMRKINLYSISSSIETVSSLSIDVSPSVLFPHYDPDTSILYIWGKGERVIQAFEVHPENSLEPISKLPSFTSGDAQLGVAWLPKRLVDVRKVEVMKALRLTARAIEEVSFTIPRNKPAFFQDDIYLPTVDIESYPITTGEWLRGDDALPRYIDLKPDDMTLLSEAPQINTPAKKKFVPAANIMSEEEKKKQEMDEMFARAKLEESSDEDEVRTGIDPPDDDW